MRTQNIVVRWNDVKDAFENIVSKGQPVPAQWGHNAMIHNLRRMALDPYRESPWEGGKASDTLRDMRHGFKSPELEAKGKYVKTVDRKRKRYNDCDGTLDFDRLMSGDPDFFGKRDKRTDKPGMKLNIEMAFACSVDAPVIAQYGAFVAGFIAALEKRGIDLEVNIRSSCTEQFSTQRGEIQTDVDFRVKERGEKSRFSAWSVLFSPTGYRHLLFTGYLVAGEQVGEQVTYNLGTTLPNTGWGVEYDQATNTVTIRCDQRARQCDISKLNADAKSAGLL